MRIYTIFFAAHRDKANGEQCRFSNREVHPNFDDNCTNGRAHCPYCGASVKTYDGQTDVAVEGGAA